jgi:Arc/MetJ family transcription regulator
MRTNIELDDELVQDAMRLSGIQTKREVVELGLKTLVKWKKQASLLKLKGKIKWDGDLEKSRKSW